MEYRRIIEYTQEELKTFDEAMEALAGKPE